ncbi:TonB-dependent receptor [Chitinophaga costaii]|nr:TonB-dependent receptor [Chitinophaga costaii]
MYKKLSLFSAFIISGITGWAQTATQSDSITNLAEVAVASRKVSRIADIAGTVWVLGESRIQEQAKNGVPLKEMLGILVPGLDIGAQGRSNYGQNLRGRSVLIMIDGVSINSLRTISRQLDAIDPFNIARIEVLSGASSIYGGDATGGIINIITKKASHMGFGGSTEVGARAGLRHSDDHDWRIAQAIQGMGRKWSGRAAISYQQNGASYGGNNEQIFTDITQTDLQYNRTINVMGSGSYKFNDQHSLTATVQYYDSKTNGDRSLYLGDSLKAYATGNGSLLAMKDGFHSDIVPKTERYMANLAYTGNNILGGQRLYIQGAYRTERLDFYAFPSTTILSSGASSLFMSASRQNTNYGGAKVVLSKDWNRFGLIYGVDADFESFTGNQGLFDISESLTSGGLVNKQFATVPRYPHVKTTTLSGYLQGSFKILPVLQLDAGIRYQNSDIHLDNFIAYKQAAYIAYGRGKTASAIPGGSKSYDMAIANAKLLYKPSVNDQAWFSFSQGVSLADPAKYFGTGTYKYNTTTENWDLSKYFSIDNAALQGIKTNLYEVGYRSHHGGFNGQASVYLSQSNKDRRTDGTTYQVLIYDNKVRTMGLEGAVSYTIKHVEIGVSGQWIITKTKTDSTHWAKQNIAYASPSKLVSYISYGIGKWNFRYQNTNSFNLGDEDGNELKAFNLSDLFVGYKLPVGKINVGVQNLINTKYQTIWSQRSTVLYAGYKLPEMFYYQGRGRTVSVNYSIDF